MKKRFSLGLAAFVGLVLVASTAQASITFDQNITAIFGSGSADTNWTADSNAGVTLGLRAKVRFNSSNQPENTFNSLGNGTYVHEKGTPGAGLAKWNFEWSINSGASLKLNQLKYKLEIDYDPGWGTNYLSFDPINLIDPLFADHAIGTDSTASGGGVEASDRNQYVALINGNNVAQNSWNLGFFDTPDSSFYFNPNADAHYSFRLSAYQLDDGPDILVAQTFMHVVVGRGVVPEPTSLLSFGGLMLVGLGFTGRRRAK